MSETSREPTETERSDDAPFELRDATPADARWLWHLYAELMKPSIDVQWGWVEELQREAFDERLPWSAFSVVVAGGRRVGAYACEREPNRLYLHMLLVEVGSRRRGIGTRVLDRLGEEADRADLPLELSVIEANPAARFYETRGFERIGRGDGFLRYRRSTRG